MKVTYTVWLELLSMEIGRYANSNIMEFVFTIALLDTKMNFVLMVLFFVCSTVFTSTYPLTCSFTSFIFIHSTFFPKKSTKGTEITEVICR